MILPGTDIEAEIAAGNITISPFSSEHLNPQGYDYHLGDRIREFSHFEGDRSQFGESRAIPEAGLVLLPNTLYLGHTFEKIGSSKFAMSLTGRSALGRLGLFVQLANLGHTGTSHCWTLEIYAVRPIRVYPNLKIGQVSFWSNCGEVEPYQGRYSNSSGPQESVLQLK
ncbi:MAG: deoxycytidine deaminase [Cyanobacteria bacterium J06641_5]